MPALNQNYVFIPQRLVADFQANPAAIGVYALLARLFLIYQEPIPLSAADLQRYDPSLSYGAARGALQRLTALRWLIDQSGHKNQYTPTWGVIKSAASPWRMDAPTLGRPAHVVTLRLDRRLLDVGMGKFIPHPAYPAQTSDRYLEQPILSLRDVGAYAQVLNGQALAATPALWRYGLIQDGVPQPLPDVAELIALASQRTLEGDGAAPTKHGRRRLGLQASTSPPARAGQPLFFVDHALIPDPITDPIPDLILSTNRVEPHQRAVECANSGREARPPRMAESPGTLKATRYSPPNPPTLQHGGGGAALQAKSESERGAPQTESESAVLLRSVNAFPSSIDELASMPAELVRQAIAYAQSEPGIESVAGWVVEALRQHRDKGWPIPTPGTRHTSLTSRERSIDIEAYTGGAYGDLFRLGSDISDLEDVPVDQPEAVFVLPSANALTLAPEEAPGEVNAHTHRDAASASAPPTDSPPQALDNELTRQMQAELRLRCGRKRGRVIDGLRLHAAGDTSLLICATLADLEIVQRELLGALQHILSQLKAPPQLVFTTRAGWKARNA